VYRPGQKIGDISQFPDSFIIFSSTSSGMLSLELLPANRTIGTVLGFFGMNVPKMLEIREIKENNGIKFQ